MEQYYSDEKNVQILVALLKEHGIKRIIASPGSTNVTFVGSVQQDSFFEVYSCVDERSAAYMACGMAVESGEPVALSCTGATASRNYFSALTEAFYRKIPIVAITSTQDPSRIGHLYPQTLDRTMQPKDVVKMSVYLQNIKDAQDEWDCMIKANNALLELKHHGGGPVHINLATTYSNSFLTKELPHVNVIKRHNAEEVLPNLPKGSIAVFVGSHQKWSERLLNLLDAFCERHNAVVFTDPTSNYNGKYGICYDLATIQKTPDENKRPDLLIHIGNMSDSWGILEPKNVWRVSEDGNLADPYKKLRRVFEMKEETFFEHYSNQDSSGVEGYLFLCKQRKEKIESMIPELPFSNIWMAKYLHNMRPANSVWHYGILSSLRSWRFFDKQKDVDTYCNQGGFGIDGNMSSLIGASLVHPEKLYFGVVGDLSFFYDMNSLGNRHVGPNIRILLINNSLGAEFHMVTQLNSIYVNNVDNFISAGGHFGHKSPTLVKSYVESLGFKYITASNKEEFAKVVDDFISVEYKEKPIVFEVFTDVENEDEALYDLLTIESSFKSETKQKIKNLMAGNGVHTNIEKKYLLSINSIKNNENFSNKPASI